MPDGVLAAVARNPRASERKQLATLLSLWDSVALGALGGAGLKRWSSLTADQRERVLLAWADSRAPQRRAVFQALRKAALLFYYMLPGPERGAQSRPGTRSATTGRSARCPTLRPRRLPPSSSTGETCSSTATS